MLSCAAGARTNSVGDTVTTTGSKKMISMADKLDMNRAYATYLELLNGSRPVKRMTLDLNNPLDPEMQTRYALLNVLTTGAELTVEDIKEALERMGCLKTRSSIASSLRRLKNSQAVVGRHTPRRRHGGLCKTWKLTQSGAQLPKNPPVSTPKNTTTKSSKQSSARIANMCIDATKPTMNKAIEDVIASFVKDGKAFSAYDITGELRRQAASGQSNIDPKETAPRTVAGVSTLDISHDYVRDAVHELYHLKQIPGYGRSHTGMFWQYHPLAAPSTLPSTPADSTDTDPNGSSYDGTPTL